MQKKCLDKFWKFSRKHFCWSLFHKFVGYRPCLPRFYHCQRNPVQRKYRNFFKDFNSKRVLTLRDNETKIATEKAFDRNHFGTVGNHKMTKEHCLSDICSLVTHPLTLTPWKRYIYVFRAYFRFCNFYATLSYF